MPTTWTKWPEGGDPVVVTLAATPDVLEALENAVRIAERDGVAGCPGSSPGWVFSARAAIARAKGGQ